MVIGHPAQLIHRIFDSALIGRSRRIHTMHLLGVFIDWEPSTPWFHCMFVHLKTPIPSCSIAFSSILGPHHLWSIFSTWHQETGALGFWASGGLRRRLLLVWGRHQLTWSSGILGFVSIMVSAFSVMRPSSTACALTHLTVHYPVPTSYSILRSKGWCPCRSEAFSAYTRSPYYLQPPEQQQQQQQQLQPPLPIS